VDFDVTGQPRALSDDANLALTRTAAAGYPALETANGGYGLAGMRERLLLINGSLSAGPDHGNWVVTAQVPQ
jgi:glucose-6-phosphate-specific signal transduction histidine kinase